MKYVVAFLLLFAPLAAYAQTAPLQVNPNKCQQGAVPVRAGTGWFCSSALTSGVQLPAVTTYSALPTCNSGREGLMQPISDSNSTTFNATISGGSTNHVIAYCNGTNYKVH